MTDRKTAPDDPAPFDINEARRAHDKVDEFFDYVNESNVKTAELAMKMAILINGGGAVALLTFVGTLPQDQKRLISETLVWFAYGVAAGVITLVLAFFTNITLAVIANSMLKTWQHPYLADGPTTKCFRVVRIVCLIATYAIGAAALLFFIYGVLAVRDALTKLT